MPYGVITHISLEPYSTKSLIFVSGYSGQELYDYLDASYIMHENVTPTLKKIKSFNIEKKELLEFVKKDMSDFDLLNDETAVGRGCFFYDNPKGLYIIGMRAGFNPYDPENMTSLAHEVLHLCQVFLPQFFERDIEMENEAYFHSRLMREIYMSFIPNYHP